MTWALENRQGISINNPAAPTAPNQPGAPADIKVAAVTKDDWVKGDRNAKISVIEYSSSLKSSFLLWLPGENLASQNPLLLSRFLF